MGVVVVHFLFGSMRQIKLAIRQLLGACKYSVSYRILLILTLKLTFGTVTFKIADIRNSKPRHPSCHPTNSVKALKETRGTDLNL